MRLSMIFFTILLRFSCIKLLTFHRYIVVHVFKLWSLLVRDLE